MGEGERGLFGFIANGSREQERKGGERETPWEDDSEPFKMPLLRSRRRGCSVLVSHPPPQETTLGFYGDLSFLVRGEVPFSAFTTPFSW